MGRSKVSLKETKKHPEKWDEVFRRYSPLISAKIRNWNSSALGLEAEDILQEVRLRLWKAMDNGEIIECFPAYLRKVTDSVIISHFRKIRNSIEYRETRATQVHTEQKKVDENLDLPIMAKRIYEKLPLIVENRRIVLSLFLAGLTLREIAEKTDFSLAKTRILYYRGIRELKKRIHAVGS